MTEVTIILAVIATLSHFIPDSVLTECVFYCTEYEYLTLSQEIHERLYTSYLPSRRPHCSGYDKPVYSPLHADLKNVSRLQRTKMSRDRKTLTPRPWPMSGRLQWSPGQQGLIISRQKPSLLVQAAWLSAFLARLGMTEAVTTVMDTLAIVARTTEVENFMMNTFGEQ
ncbi:hypothetical protein QCA50_005152 [Cerrena zonata]|uniref:Uncharacterized protein n=1 Tax=Cerrena zonata TaxID=2478898 RepID=A0AAW0GG62_9APHY